MSERVSIRQLRENLSDFVDQARQGEDVVVTNRGTEVARLTAVEPAGSRPLGLLKGQIHMAPDFDAALVEVPHEMVAAIDEAVASGDYADREDVLRDALRDWKMKRKLETLDIEFLRALVKEGEDSGPAIDGDLVVAELRAKYAAMVDKSG